MPPAKRGTGTQLVSALAGERGTKTQLVSALARLGFIRNNGNTMAQFGALGILANEKALHFVS